MKLGRRAILAGLAAAPFAARAEVFAGRYTLVPEVVAPGVWLVRGADAAISFANGGAIANAVILAASDPRGSILIDCGPSLAYGRALGALAEKLTGGPVQRLFITHLHPDHAMGAAAFPPDRIAALPGTIKDLERDSRGFSDAMYRILADWMRGTEIVPPGLTVSPGAQVVAGRALTAYALSGHSAGDLALRDEATGTLITGDLVFHNRAPATPHADLAQWRASLDRLANIPHARLIPGHGPLDTGKAIAQTRDWLDWLESTLRQAVRDGLDMGEAGDLPIPARFDGVAMARYEFQRSVSHLYPRLEAEILPTMQSD
jgi:quinoprotein relay system zinc metallohydrolase 1